MSLDAVQTEYFFGNKISDYGLENGRVDYGTLAKAFDAVLANTLFEELVRSGAEYDIVNGSVEYHEDGDGNILTPEEAEDKIATLEDQRQEEGIDDDEIDEIDAEIEQLIKPLYYGIYQYYVISSAGYKILKHWTDEIVFDFPEYGVMFWGVTHYGTAWNHVLTQIQCPKRQKKETVGKSG